MARADFNHMAANYDDARGLSEETLEMWCDLAARYLPERRPLSLLDLGCGTGRFSDVLARRLGARVIAVDPAREMLRQATEKRRHPSVTYLLGRAEAIPLREGSCHAAWLSTVIHHFSDVAAVARQLRRLVLTGGPVLVRSWFPGREDITHFRFFPSARPIAESFPTIEDTTSAFAAAGFEVEALEAVPQVSAPSLRAFCERVRLRADTTLAALSDDEFAHGLAALEEAAAAETEPRPVISPLDLLVLRRRP